MCNSVRLTRLLRKSLAMHGHRSCRIFFPRVYHISVVSTKQSHVQFRQIFELMSKVEFATKDKDVTFCYGYRRRVRFLRRNRRRRGPSRANKKLQKDPRLHTLHSRTPPRDSRPASRVAARRSGLFLLTVSTAGMPYQPVLSSSPFNLCLASLFERYQHV